MTMWILQSMNSTFHSPSIYNEKWRQCFNNCPVFYVLAQHTHYPQYAGLGAAGKSLRGPYGDALLEFDNTVGNLLKTLEKTGVIKNTLVFFTSDNGFVFPPFILCPNKSMTCTSSYVQSFFLICLHCGCNTLIYLCSKIKLHKILISS